MEANVENKVRKLLTRKGPDQKCPLILIYFSWYYINPFKAVSDSTRIESKHSVIHGVECYRKVIFLSLLHKKPIRYRPELPEF